MDALAVSAAVKDPSLLPPGGRLTRIVAEWRETAGELGALLLESRLDFGNLGGGCLHFALAASCVGGLAAAWLLGKWGGSARHTSSANE